MKATSLAGALALCLASVPTRPVAAQAVEQQGCAEEYVQAQRARKEGKLLTARKHLLACTRELCMDVIERDCASWLQEVDASMPSIVVVARDRWGDETLNVRVLVDGEVVRDVLDAKAISVDPGQHLFRFETMDTPPVEQKLIVREGEQNRRVDVQFGVGTPSAGALDAERAPPPGEHDSGAFGLRELGWVLAGVGGASVVSGALFLIAGSAAQGDLEDSGCASSCQPEFSDSIDRQDLIGAVLVGVGVAAAGTAVYLLVWGTDDDGANSAARLRLHAASDGARMTLGGRF